MGLNTTKYIEYIRSKQKAISAFFVIFYTVGIIGMLLPSTFSIFLKLIPFALLLSFVALAFFHESKIDRIIMLAFLSIYLISFTIETIGVHTGKIFGNYQYGQGLGIQLFQTPLIIGINWLFLVYTTSVVVEKFNFPTIAKILLASSAMLLYDLVLEQVAPKLDLWQWKSNIIPFQNYIAWFILAVFFHSLIKISKVRLENKLAILILVCQFMFFLLLFIGFKLIL